MKLKREILPIALNFTIVEEGLPARIELLPAGKRITGRDGRSWNNPNPLAVAERSNNQGIDIVLDFEHSSELKAPKGDEAPAAAWLHDFRVEDDGRLTAAVNRWTQKGEGAVRAGEYRYVSPAVLFDPKTMNILGIGSAGLTNKPNLALAALNQEREEDPMLDVKKVLAKLGLPEDATEETVLNAIGSLQSDLQTALNSAQTPSLEKFVPRADYETALNRATTAEAKIAQGEKDRLEGEIETAINQALTEGKIAPASKEFYTATCRAEGGLEQFKAFIASAPKIVADSGLDSKQHGPTATGLNAQEKEICERLGISEDEYLKTEV